MGRPPAVVIVARYDLNQTLEIQQYSLIGRHGARLDAADTQWHLTSPTPYDPPLTWGGWRQSQALGARIASIIQNREAAASGHTSHAPNGDLGIDRDGVDKERRHGHHSQRGKRRRHKVVVHSSPFLRCVQTSIAISAGMAQYQGASKPTGHQSHPKPHIMHSGSPHLQAMDDRNSPRLSAIPEPEHAGVSRRRNTSRDSRGRSRTLLRVDPFLGEWLSPEYFDKITPPPESKLMVASAKGELLRQADSDDMIHTSNRKASTQGLWTGGVSASNKSQSSDEDTPLNDFSSLSKNMPRFGRANSHSVGSLPSSSSSKLTSRVERSPARESAAYVAPIPSYAVSPSQPIPQGYVAHARDACVKVDSQWDSLRPPLEWGNGGEYGEEWSNMHKRFRHGLHEMIVWYRSHESSETLEPMSDGSPQSQNSQSTQGTQSLDASDDDDVDTVLVLVTHGAGCNALIGALTNQPVLIDVGMASLTMAVRKSVDYKRVASPTSEVPPTSPSRRRQWLVDFGISEDYEVKLVSSTEHLRAGSPFLAGPRVKPNVPVRDKSPYRYERPGFSTTPVPISSAMEDGFGSDSDGSTSTPTGNRFGGLQRSAPTAAKSSSGLWSKPEPKKLVDTVNKDTKRPSPRVVQNGSGTHDSLDGISGKTNGNHLEQVKSDPSNGDHTGRNLANGFHDHAQRERSIAPNGLWGAPPQALATERETGPKRRWTLSQAS